MRVTGQKRSIDLDKFPSTPTDKDLFSVIKKIGKGDKAAIKDSINERFDVGGSDQIDEAYLVAAHCKRTPNVDYQIMAEMAGHIAPDLIDDFFKKAHGITPDSLLMVLTFARTDAFDQSNMS